MSILMQTSGNFKKEEISAYFHIPFCTRKCDYCHFFVIPDRERDHEILTGALKLEWEHYKGLFAHKKIPSIYFGGGTPSLLKPYELEEILNRIPFDASCEITLEANPENGTKELFQSFKALGINRCSLGVQSLDDPLLKKLSREHSAKKAIDAVINIYEAGITNISIDLMYDLPGQTLNEWRSTLDRVKELPLPIFLFII